MAAGVAIQAHALARVTVTFIAGRAWRLVLHDTMATAGVVIAMEITTLEREGIVECITWVSG